jgi:predicted Zn-dependent protease
MSLPDESRAISLLRDALRRGGWPAIATLRAHELDACRFAESRVHQAAALRNHGVVVRVFRDGRMGTASTNELAPDALDRVLGRAADAARAMPALPAGFPIPESGAGRVAADAGEGTAEFAAGHDAAASARAWDEATAKLRPEEKTALLGAAFGRARGRGVRLAGAWKTGGSLRVVVDTAGRERQFRSTFADLGVWALRWAGTADVSAWQGRSSNRTADFDVAELADAAVERCLLQAQPSDFAPGPCDVVLSAEALGEVMDWLAITGFDSRTHLDGTGFLAGREGERVTGESISLADDGAAALPGAFPLPFDDDGVTCRRVSLIEAGRAVGPVHSRFSAARAGAGCSSTGHSFVGGSHTSTGGVPARLVFAPGAAELEQLVGGVERGVFVSRFHYVNGMLDPRKALMTGLTRDGTFLIQDGQLRGGLRNLRWVEPMLDALARADAVGSELRAVPTFWMDSGVHLCPAIRIRGFHFTGAQELAAVAG